MKNCLAGALAGLRTPSTQAVTASETCRRCNFMNIYIDSNGTVPPIRPCRIWYTAIWPLDIAVLIEDTIVMCVVTAAYEAGFFMWAGQSCIFKKQKILNSPALLSPNFPTLAGEISQIQPFDLGVDTAFRIVVRGCPKISRPQFHRHRSPLPGDARACLCGRRCCMLSTII